MTDDQPERKATWAAMGRYWSTTRVPRLYLEDIENIFDVMRIYAPNSPSAIRETEKRKWADALYALELEKYNRADPKPATPPVAPPPLDFPISMETEDYIARSKEQLRKIQPKTASHFEMRVGFYDLTVSCFNWMISVTTSSDDPTSTRAFDEIRRIIERREKPSRTLPLIGRLRFLALSLLLVVAVINLFLSNAAISIANLALAVLAWWLVVLWGRLWARSMEARTIVILRTRDEAPSFWEEHRRGIAAALISGAILAVLGTALALVAQR